MPFVPDVSRRHLRPIRVQSWLTSAVIATNMTRAMQEDEATYARLSAMHPFAGGGFGHAIDVARAVLFLCSAGASFVNGATLRVDDGSVATMST